jgi:hypothetical protein
MKYYLFLLPILLLASASNATPINNATIVQNGNEFSSISRLYQKTPKVTGWIKLNDDSIYSPWARQWAEYTAFLTKGVWDIGLNASNRGNLEAGSGWYNTFRVRSRLTDPALIAKEILEIKASDTQSHYGLSRVDIATAGDYTVRYTWLNDKWGGHRDPLRRDANIQINSVFFNRVPEPSSLALLTLGAILLVARKRSRPKCNEADLSALI